MRRKSRYLTFQQIVDDRFDTDILELLNTRIKTLGKLLSVEGLEVNIGEPYLVDWSHPPEKNKQYRADFRIRKFSRKLTWNDVFKIVNSVKVVSYNFS